MKHDIYVMRQCVYTYLRYIRDTDKGIRELENQIITLRNSLEARGMRFDRIGGRSANTNDVMADAIARIIELEEEWSDRITAHFEEINAARDLCSPVFNGRYALWLHIVDGCKWSDVGRAIGYSESMTRRIAQEAIAGLYAALPEQFRRDTFPNAMI